MNIIIVIRTMTALIIRTLFGVCILMSILYASSDFASHKPLSNDKYFAFFSTPVRFIITNILIEIITDLMLHG